MDPIKLYCFNLFSVSYVSLSSFWFIKWLRQKKKKNTDESRKPQTALNL